MPVTTVSKGLCMYKLKLIAAYTCTIQRNWNYSNCLVTIFLLIDIKDLADIIKELEAQQFDYTKWSELGLYLGLY